MLRIYSIDAKVLGSAAGPQVLRELTRIAHEAGSTGHPLRPREWMRTGRGVELGRLVLDDAVPGNGETWFLARAFKLVRQALEIEGIVSFCDPVRRVATAGREVKRSHTGVIYRSHNAKLAGRTLPRTQLLMPKGLCASDRALSKIRNEEVYAMRQLLDAGARRRFLGESSAEWIRRLRHEGFLRAVRHPGNFAFTWTWK